MPARSPLPSGQARRNRLSIVIVAWLVAGTADILVAVTYYPLTAAVTPVGILRGIASGLLGAAAFSGGYATAALGLVCHYAIALIWTLVFFYIYPRLAFLARSVPLTAVLYGTFVSLVMTFVVLPLSRVGPRAFHASAFAVATVILWFTIGLPLALFARRRAG
ncbi:MAG: hypothetical protein KGN74_04985 [Gemmatimonadota bacterium]|nr:hypothetical protein [Gemmatimonadota bacterium]MDE3172408.1 hypothetical protein [Gemmatimonadota bacterium]MDE3216731.1 hypothetical protein [Gemmatimonadota bacterium]